MSARRVLPTGNPAAAALYCVAPDRLLGWPAAPPGTRPPAHPSLPEVARLNPYDLAASVAAVRSTAADPVLSWLDYPPAPNRIIGLAWLARLFHGANIDVAAEAAAFHALFYGQRLSEADLAEILLHAGIRVA